MLHPVGPLPAAAYWRRRVLVLALLTSVLGGGGWLGWAAVTGAADGTTTAAATSSVATTTPPALERVVPALAVQTPASAGPCTDAMIRLEVRTPGLAAAASPVAFELVVTNVSALPCVRALDPAHRELVLLDATGARVWGSDDCLAPTGGDPRTLAPGEAVSVPVPWTGLTSEPTCTAPQVPPPPGGYVVRARLDAAVSGDAPLTIGQL